jgi:3-isopropylmalate/(R)-2-methylmalate dehydratase small subunit
MLAEIFSAVDKNPKAELMIDLEAQSIEIVGTGHKESFEISPYKKECLKNGYDDVDYLVSIRNEVENFENKR